MEGGPQEVKVYPFVTLFGDKSDLIEPIQNNDPVMGLEIQELIEKWGISDITKETYTLQDTSTVEQLFFRDGLGVSRFALTYLPVSYREKGVINDIPEAILGLLESWQQKDNVFREFAQSSYWSKLITRHCMGTYPAGGGGMFNLYDRNHLILIEFIPASKQKSIGRRSSFLR